MPESKISEQLSQAQTRMANLHQRASYSLLHQQGLLPDAFEELHTTVEELRVAEEEMRAQNDELIATRQRLEAERHRYQDLFEYAPEGYLVTTEVGKILEANQAASRSLNIAPRFLRNRPLAASVHKEDLREFMTRLTEFVESTSFGTSQEWTLRLSRRQYSSFPAILTVARVKSLPHETVTLRWTVRDISEQKQIEDERLMLAREQAARAEAEAGHRRITAILEAITDLCITLDKEWRFTFLNPGAAQLCRSAGKDPEILLGQVIWEAFPTALGTAFQTEALRAFETEQMTEFEEYSQGLGRRLHVKVFPSHEGVVACAQDVTMVQETGGL